MPMAGKEEAIGAVGSVAQQQKPASARFLALRSTATVPSVATKACTSAQALACVRAAGRPDRPNRTPSRQNRPPARKGIHGAVMGSPQQQHHLVLPVPPSRQPCKRPMVEDFLYRAATRSCMKYLCNPAPKAFISRSMNPVASKWRVNIRQSFDPCCQRQQMPS